MAASIKFLFLKKTVYVGNIKMKKIGIITHYGVHNHGAQLQLFALINVLQNNGYEATALRFEKDYRYMNAEANSKYSISLKSIPFYLKYLFSKGLKKTLFNIRKKIIFDKFRKKNKILGELYSKFINDLIIVGSDEVFSVETGVTDAFWGNNAKCRNIISYAGSFGPTTLDEIKQKKLEDYISTSINNFSSIAVRDKNSKEIIETLSSKNAQLTCDPVILYGYENEIKVQKRKIKEDYILLYSYDNNVNSESDISLVQHISKELELPVYSIGFYHKWCDKNINADPIELLGYFKNAKYIITDTFHGTVMSLITESNFATKLCGNSNKLFILLSEYNLQNRIFDNAEGCIDVLQREVNYEDVNRIICENRNNSKNYLLEEINRVIGN